MSFIHKTIWVLSLLLVLHLSGCTDNDGIENSTIGKETVVDFNFGDCSFKRVDIKTRATLGILPESRVNNLFVFIFANGKRIYSHHFNSDDKLQSLSELQNQSEDAWYVVNMQKEDDDETHGTVRIKCPTVTDATMYLVANIDADMVNISPERLNAITTEAELNSMKAQLNQEVTSRNGYFPMTAKVENITIEGNNITSSNADALPAQLKRLDAKVKVNIKVSQNNTTITTEGNTTTRQTIKEFRPESWRVVNVPKAAYAFEQTDNADTEYFNSNEMPFETESTDNNENTLHGFSFYMLENKQKAKVAPLNFHERDQRKKKDDGSYDTSGDLWTKAPENGTYLEIKGEVVMDVDVSSEAKEQHLSADVVYYIHLGDFAGNKWANYDVERNTFYTYNITVNGVNSIQVEVETSQPGKDFEERESGATGHVYIAKESIHTFDAHYGQRVFCFDAEYINPETVTWYVKTPFGNEGTPVKVGDTEIPSGLDYEWAHFMINEVSATRDDEAQDTPYSQLNQKYPGDQSDKLMDVVQFTKYIKEQKRKFDKGQANDFHKEVDEDWKQKFPDDASKYIRSRIYVTVFIDEFYYDTDPITGKSSEDLWKKFVNQPNRLMHILCDSETSLDKASTATGSVITLRQRSIQTPYALNKDELKTAWGCETIDESSEEAYGINWFFSTDENSTTYHTESLTNSDSDNGLYNTALLWDMNKGSIKWNDYLDYGRNNDNNILFMKDNKAVLRYAAMMRNRDNNGNGIIDPEEVRWYVASLGQLDGLYIGEQGLSGDAKLYKRSFATAPNETFDASSPYSGFKKWRSHIISSTVDNKRIKVLWAEEGVSVCFYKEPIEKKWQDDKDKTIQSGAYSIRCVRNLGMPDATASTITDKTSNRPTPLINVIKPNGTITSSSVYRFDMTNVNDKSLRYYTTRELEPADENSEIAKVYKGFETGSLKNFGKNYTSLKSTLESGNSPCDDGYRVPNIREGALMSLYCDYDWWNGIGTMVSSYFSLGKLGTNVYFKNNANLGISWRCRYNHVTVGEAETYIRQVRDYNP